MHASGNESQSLLLDFADELLDISMIDPGAQKSGCFFVAKAGAQGKPIIRFELFHQTVPTLAGLTVEFELLSGTTLEQAKKLAESIDERIIGICARPETKIGPN